MNYINRNLEKVVAEVTKEYPVVLVTGPRQVGKTTMLLKMMKGTNRRYVTLDDLNERNLAKTDPELFLQMHKPPVLIDEVQYAPELFSYIKIHVDKTHAPGDFWLTGSQVFRLMKGVQESLAGRVAVLSLTSLSQTEIYGGTMSPFTVDMDALSERAVGRAVADTITIFERIYKGSMPAIVSGANSNSQIFYSSYLSTYIERDVRGLSDAIDSLKFLRFITAVAARCGQMLNVADIARDADINQTQAKNWMGILETLGIIFYLHQRLRACQAGPAVSGYAGKAGQETRSPHRGTVYLDAQKYRRRPGGRAETYGGTASAKAPDNAADRADAAKRTGTADIRRSAPERGRSGNALHAVCGRGQKGTALHRRSLHQQSSSA